MTSETERDRGIAKLEELLRHVGEKCLSCGICVESCQFLQTYGTPRSISRSCSYPGSEDLVMPFECNLCGFCSSVCPSQVKPRDLFLEMRREAVRCGKGTFAEHAALLNYEKKGASRQFSWYGLPWDCDTVFFPGCALPGTRPKQTKKVFEILRQRTPSMGIVLDCCTKPSHDLGRQKYFLAMFGEMKQYLVAQGIRRVVVACPNCYAVFREYAPELTTVSVYEVLTEDDKISPCELAATVTMHDPCSIRDAIPVQDAVRKLAVRTGVSVAEMRHGRSRALCCGEGGGAAALAPHFAAAWVETRVTEAAGRTILTSCAGCAHSLGAHTKTVHVLDLMLDPGAALSGTAPVSRAPFTYLNRFLLKRHFRNSLPVDVSRERNFRIEQKSRGVSKTLVLSAVLIAAIALSRMTGLGQYLDQDTLRSFIAGYGALAPVIYMLLYTLAPAFFLPGLPITLAGGVLFGPFWGVVYTIIGATSGACVAFLVSRYLARGWVEAKLSGSRWRKLDSEVEKHGWKVVAFPRLIPLFPFNLLNYAFGLTRIRFIDYTVATFLCMLPACIAFIVFSSSLLDLLRGRISARLLLGIALVAAVSLLPVLYRRISRRKKSPGMKAGAEQ